MDYKKLRVVESLQKLYEPLDEVGKAIVEETSLDSSIRNGYLIAHSELLNAINKVIHTYEAEEKIGQQLEN